MASALDGQIVKESKKMQEEIPKQIRQKKSAREYSPNQSAAFATRDMREKQSRSWISCDKYKQTEETQSGEKSKLA